MKRRIIIMGIVLAVVFGGLIGWNFLRSKLRQDYLKKHAPGPTVVSVMTVAQKSSQPTLAAVGTINASEQVNVTSQMGGKVEKILFKDGQQVKKGQLLVVLDDEAQQGQLQAALAQRDAAADAVRRFKPLAEEGAISQLRYDEMQAKLDAANGQLQQARAALSFVRVTAPFDGRVGIRQVNIGQMVQPGVNLVTLDTAGGLYIDFTLPEANYGRISVGRKVTVTTDAAPGKKFSAEIVATNPQVDTSTRNFGVRASLPTDEPALTPGSFANVAVDVDAPMEVIMIPQTAINYTLYGDTVFVLDASTKTKKDGVEAYKLKKTPVTLGEEHGEDVIVKTGLEAGEQIVTAGQLRLQDGDWATPKASDDLEAPKQVPED